MIGGSSPKAHELSAQSWFHKFLTKLAESRDPESKTLQELLGVSRALLVVSQERSDASFVSVPHKLNSLKIFTVFCYC